MDRSSLYRLSEKWSQGIIPSSRLNQAQLKVKFKEHDSMLPNGKQQILLELPRQENLQLIVKKGKAEEKMQDLNLPFVSVLIWK